MDSAWAKAWTRLTLMPPVWRVPAMFALFLVSYLAIIAAVSVRPSWHGAEWLVAAVAICLVFAPLLVALLLPFAWPSVRWYWSALFALEAYVLIGLIVVNTADGFHFMHWERRSLLFWMWPPIVHAQLGCYVPLDLPCWEFPN